MNPRRVSLIPALLVALQSQACTRPDAKVSQPHEFVGRWARLGADTAWSDTVELAADGGVRGALAVSTADTLRWAVVQTRFGKGFCLGPRRQPHCQAFRLEGDTLILGRLAAPSYWRRTHSN